MYMKIILITLFTCLLSVASFAQDRVTIPAGVQTDRTLPTYRDIIGSGAVIEVNSPQINIIPAITHAPNIAGVTWVGSFESASGGNGAIYGFGFYNNHNFTDALSLNTKLSFTWDTKSYLHKAGIAPRLHADVRYHLPIASDNHRTFVQVGLVAGGVQYSGQGGYAKYGVQPSAGFGFDFSPNDELFSLVGTFKYKFKSPLYGQQSFFNAANKVKDGWTQGFEVGVESFHPLSSIFSDASYSNKWGLIFNVAAGRSVYQRNSAVYGPVLGAEHHHVPYVDISIGIGRKY